MDGASGFNVGTRRAFLRDGDLWLWPLDAGAPPSRLTAIGVAGIGRVPLGTYNRADLQAVTDGLRAPAACGWPSG